MAFERKGKRVALDVSGMYDPGVDNTNIQQKVTAFYWGENVYEVTGYFSNDGTRYVSTWLIMHDGAIRSHISSFEELFKLEAKVKKDFNYVSLKSIMKENSNPKK